MIKIDVTVPVGYTDGDIRLSICGRLPIKNEEIKEIHVLREKLDVGDEITYKLSVGVSLSAEREAGLLR